MGLSIREDDIEDIAGVRYDNLTEGVWYSVNYPQYVVLVDRDLRRVCVDKSYGFVYGPFESKGHLPELSPLKKAGPITFYNKE